MLVYKILRSFLADPEYRDLLVTTFVLLVIGATAYRYLEDWSWVDSFYFSIITLTTVGYGDITPQTDGGKIFTIFYIILGVSIMLAFINTVYTHYSKVRSDRKIDIGDKDED